ncbi:cation diffusion facilitator family transporter [Spongiibacter taiwanensis]|uniref:cation diffusion facilitator family transporter n=1 Tax=Spongiibacter taiwanensis TaxID=1748242 RepID=UPI002035A642|nr:cation diffusion facilitator family transporter [Spongiibacter taiwanensis]USA43493.1 cation diffusion facilitator family transporter [Spongiibacter taiwanensis]
MGHGHSHHHHHDYGADGEQRIAWAFALNLGFTIIEFIGGALTNSTAIMADAVHDLGDSLAIGLAWVLQRLGRRSASDSFTYGYRRLSLLGALINGLILIGGSVWVLSTAIPRLFDPVMPVAEGMLALAVLGVAVNGYAAYRLSEGKSLNERVLNWHLIEDVLGWVAVLVVSLVLMVVDWPILDPLLSIAFSVFILVNVCRTVYQTLRLFVQAVPDRELHREIRQRLDALPEVDSAHHVHLWSLDGEHHVLTAHLSLKRAQDAASQTLFKGRIASALADFSLAHTTIELEFPDEACRDQSSAHRHHHDAPVCGDEGSRLDLHPPTGATK